MSDYSPMEFFQSAVKDGMRIFFTATCEQRDGKVLVTLSREGESQTFTLSEDMLDADSDAMREALALPMGAAYKAINTRLEARKPKRKAKAKKRKKAKRSKKSPALPASSETSPAAAGAEASAVPATPESGDA